MTCKTLRKMFLNGVTGRGAVYYTSGGTEVVRILETFSLKMSLNASKEPKELAFSHLNDQKDC